MRQDFPSMEGWEPMLSHDRSTHIVFTPDSLEDFIRKHCSDKWNAARDLIIHAQWVESLAFQTGSVALKPPPTRTVLPANGFPNELILSISEHIFDGRVLGSLRSVSKRFEGLITPRCFERLTIPVCLFDHFSMLYHPEQMIQILKRFENCSGSKAILCHVRSLIIKIPFHSAWVRSKRLTGILNHFARIITKVANSNHPSLIQKLGFELCGYSGVDVDHDFEAEIQRKEMLPFFESLQSLSNTSLESVALTTIMGTNFNKSLASLIFRHLHPTNLKSFKLQPTFDHDFDQLLCPFSQHLRSLSLDTPPNHPILFPLNHLSLTECSGTFHPWTIPQIQNLLSELTATLSSLKLHKVAFELDDFGPDIPPISFQKLRRLELNFVINPVINPNLNNNLPNGLLGFYLAGIFSQAPIQQLTFKNNADSDVFYPDRDPKKPSPFWERIANCRIESSGWNDLRCVIFDEIPGMDYNDLTAGALKRADIPWLPL